MVKRNKRTATFHLLSHGTILVALLFSVIQLCYAKSIESYLHKNAILAVPPLSFPPPADLLHNSERKQISPREACFFAIEHLEAKGIKNIMICEVHWIASPFSGYLVDLNGKLTVEHENYTTFRIGITDGFDEGAAGEEFVFIAFGKNTKDEVLWYPRPGPDYKPAKGEVMPESFFVYEFLSGRDRFETLFDRYP